jgi:hypothetical protein
MASLLERAILSQTVILSEAKNLLTLPERSFAALRMTKQRCS